MASGDPPAVIEKIMSLAPHEFVTGCTRLAGADDSVSDQEATIAVGSGRVVIRYQPMEGVRLGGLLALPRAKVTLTYTPEVSEDEQARFTHRFDMTFQRGGG